MSREHRSPLRYPGGKSFLSEFLSATIKKNGLEGGRYVEGFAGGAGAALNLLMDEYVSEIVINDADPCVFRFWQALVDETDGFLRLLEKAKLNVGEWKRQRNICRNLHSHEPLQVGFALFYLNRTNRSGVLNGGPIGGLDQSGNYLIDVRFNKAELRRRIERIALYRERIKVCGWDAVKLLRSESARQEAQADTLIYLDPPYHDKGQRLYSQFFREKDHRRLARYLNRHRGFRWVVSYDDASLIHEIYSGEKNVVFMNYFVHSVRIGRELIIGSSECELPNEYFGTCINKAAESAQNRQSLVRSVG